MLGRGITRDEEDLGLSSKDRWNGEGGHKKGGTNWT